MEKFCFRTCIWTCMSVCQKLDLHCMRISMCKKKSFRILGFSLIPNLCPIWSWHIGWFNFHDGDITMLFSQFQNDQLFECFLMRQVIKTIFTLKSTISKLLPFCELFMGAFQFPILKKYLVILKWGQIGLHMVVCASWKLKYYIYVNPKWAQIGY